MFFAGYNETMKKMVLGCVGMTGSGKSTLVEYFASKDYPVVHFGDIVIKEAERRNNGVSDEATEKTVREEFRRQDGNEAIAKRNIPLIETHLKKSAVVIADGIYSWEEYKLLKKHYDDALKLIAVVTNKSLRYERLSDRPVRPRPKEISEKRDIAEIENIAKAGPIAFADYYIINNYGEKSLLQQADVLLKDLGLT